VFDIESLVGEKRHDLDTILWEKGGDLLTNSHHEHSGSPSANTVTMAQHEKDALPPSYIESTTTSFPDTLRGQALLDNLTLTRTTHIASIISTHILPVIEQQASYGISTTTLALLPSDIPLPSVPEKSEFSFSSADTKPVEVIGFASDEEPKVVRLEGQMNRTEFWRVGAVVVELERVLRERLNADTQLRNAIRPDVPASASSPKQTSKRGFLSKLMPALGPEKKSASGNPEVGARQVEEFGTVVVACRLEEICLRTVSEFGLYDTMTKQCVIVKADAKC
jgi:hypothetical protein